MIAYNYMFFLATKLLFDLRRRIPLYANDHARINTIYAYSLLQYFQSSQISLKEKHRLFAIYAKRFSMPISVKRMAQTLYCDPQREAFLDSLSKASIDTSAERLRNRVLHRLGRMPKHALPMSVGLKKRLTQPTLPQFTAKYTQLTYHSKKSRAERFSISEANISAMRKASEAAILCLPLGRLVKADLHALKGFKTIIVMPQMPCETTIIAAGLKSALGQRVSVEFYDPKDHHAAPYSKGDSFISDACDRLGTQFIEQAVKSPSVRRFIPPILDDDLALDISDIIYRPVQRFYAALRSVETQNNLQGRPLPVFFCGPANALPRTLSVIGQNPVFILGQGSGVVSDEDSQDQWLLKPAPKEMTQGLNAFIKTTKKRLEAALPPINQNGEKHIYIATNTRSKSYDLAHKLVEQELTTIASVATFDFAAPSGIRNLSKASLTPCLYNALHSADSGERALLSHFIQAGSRLTLDNQKLGPFPASEMQEIVSIALEQNIGALMGNVILYRMMVQKLDGVSNAQLLLLPGRHGNIRCLARAFETSKLPTLDVQVLFVSEMSRYKPPMAAQHAVIDSFARDRYVKEWGKDPATIHMIGAINLDQDIKAAKGFDSDTQRRALLGPWPGKVITFACQPLPETEIMSAIQTVAREIASKPELHLCVKLHPSQSEWLLGHISEFLMTCFSDKSRYSVLRNIPFSRVISVTDIMVSYFSNVCLMAPAFNIPVITLPTSSPMPAQSLADMGLAVKAETLDDFGAVLETVLSRAESADKALPPRGYINKNPHMMTPDSLSRLAKIVRGNFG